MNHHKSDSAADISVMENRYQQAQVFMQGFATTKLVQNETIFPHWIIDINNRTTNTFWYERVTPLGKEYRLVDAQNASNTTAFNHRLFANALAKTSNQETDAQNLPISHITISLSPLIVSFTAFDQCWQYNAEKDLCQSQDITVVKSNETLSPDGKKIAFTRDYNLWVREVATGKEQALTLDGTEDFDYAGKGLAWGGLSTIFPCQPALWSPDSSRLLTVKRDRRQVQSTPSVTHMPADGSVRPQLKRTKVAYPSDQHIETYQLLAINTESGDNCYADYLPMPAAQNEYVEFFQAKLASWANDSQHTYFIEQAQGDQILRLVKFDTHTGLTQVLIEETSKTHIDLKADAFCLPVHQFLPESNELIWYSERSGWAHIYLYDLTSGALKKTITQGQWRVRDLLWVDEKNRELFVQTSGRVVGRDPYYRDICRVHIDTGEINTVLSSDHEYCVSYRESIPVVVQNMTGRATKAASGVSPDGR
jgi:hypothetical protein